LCFPVKKVSAYKNRKPWLTSGLKKSIKIKNKLYVNSIKYPTSENKNLYKQYKAQLHRLLQRCEREYYDSLFIQYKNNMRKSWDLIKRVINKDSKHTVPDMFSIDGKNVNVKHVIANKFNKYYVNIGPSLAKNIPPTDKDATAYLGESYPNSIYLWDTNETEIINIIKQMKVSSPGWDSVSSKVIKNTYHHFLKPLVYILNLSLTQGAVPNELKIARVTPIYKSGDKMQLNNYRPVSVLPSFSKILEKLVYKRIHEFIDKHNILYKLQFGFREKHSTNLALSFLVDNIITAHEKGECVLGIFIDFSKAFDTVNHQILFRKLEHYGIRGVALKWVKSYLSNRYQFVQYNGVNSERYGITCGVPQGSILGPLFFLLYINDLANVCNKVLSILFADDTNLFLAGKDIDIMIHSMNQELETLLLWLHANKLSLNVKKTHYVIFKPGRKVVTPTRNICINNKIVQEELSTTFLGVVLDSKLSWNLHIHKIKMKMSKNIGVLLKARRVFNSSTLLTLYYSFVYPYISYCIEVWGNAAKKYTDSLFKLQKLCCRIITGSKRLTPSKPLFRSLKIMSLYEAYEYCVMLFMFKFHSGLLPDIVKPMFQRAGSNRIVTRLNQGFILPRCASKCFSNSIRFQGAKIWNKYHTDLNLLCTFYTFKFNLKTIILNQQ